MHLSCRFIVRIIMVIIIIIIIIIDHNDLVNSMSCLQPVSGPINGARPPTVLQLYIVITVIFVIIIVVIIVIIIIVIIVIIILIIIIVRSLSHISAWWVGVFGLQLTHGHIDIKTTNTELEQK